MQSVEDDKECVIPVKTGIQSVISGSPIRSALLSVEDDTVWNDILCKWYY